MMLSTHEYEMLTEIASARGLTSADVLRQYIRETHRAEFATEHEPRKTIAKGRR